MEQTYVLAAIQSEQSSPTLAQAKEMKEACSGGSFTFDTPIEIMIAGKGKRKEVLTLPMDRFAGFFPPDSTPREIEEALFRILTDLVEFAKTHLPILLGTHTSVRRKQPPREVHRFR